MKKLSFLRIYLRNHKKFVSLLLLESMVEKSKVDADFKVEFENWLSERSTLALRELTEKVGLGYWVKNAVLTDWLNAQNSPHANEYFNEVWSNCEAHNIINPLDSASWAYSH